MERNEYHSGNYDKYMSKNPLKKQMIKRLNIRIMDILEKYIQLHGGADRLGSWMRDAEKVFFRIYYMKICSRWKSQVWSMWEKPWKEQR